MSDCLHQGSSKSTADPELYEKNIAELNQLLAEGKKFELSESHEAAAEKYENAVKLASDYFGEFASEVFQPAFNYGKMLIEIARNQTGPIAPPVDLDEEDEEEPEDEQEEQKMDNQSEQQNGEADGGQNGKAEMEDEVNATKMEEEKEKQNGVDVKEGEPEEEKLHGKSETEMGAGEAKAVENGNENPPGDVTLVSENGEEKPTEEEEEEGGDIQTAWEWLEIARKICEKQEQTTTWLEHQADVHLSLGECMNVAEEFDQALTEFIKALEIRQKIFEPNNRYIAEVLFMIGVNYRNQNDFVNSAQQFEQAKNILQQIMEAKTKELEGKENDDSEKTKKLEELVELKQVVQSIEESIQDARESAEARARQLAMEMEQVNVKTSSLPTISEEDAAADNNVKVNDLTGLVKRKPVKRPHEEEDPKAGDKVMKAADELLPENGTEQHQLKNGTAETNGNGAADKLEPSAVVEQSIAAEPEQKRVKINMEVEEQQNGNGTQQAADH